MKTSGDWMGEDGRVCEDMCALVYLFESGISRSLIFQLGVVVISGPDTGQVVSF